MQVREGERMLLEEKADRKSHEERAAATRQRVNDEHEAALAAEQARAEQQLNLARNHAAAAMDELQRGFRDDVARYDLVRVVPCWAGSLMSWSRCG